MSQKDRRTLMGDPEQKMDSNRPPVTSSRRRRNRTGSSTTARPGNHQLSESGSRTESIQAAASSDQLPTTPTAPPNSPPTSSFEFAAELSRLTSEIQDASSDPSAAATLGSSPSQDGFYSMTSSHSSVRSFSTMTDSMSDLIITTGYETEHPKAVGSRTASSSRIVAAPLSGVSPEIGKASSSRQSAAAGNALTRSTSPIIKQAKAVMRWNTGPPAIPSKNAPLMPSSGRSVNVALPPLFPNPLSALSPVFIPRHHPTSSNGSQQTTDGKQQRIHGWGKSNVHSSQYHLRCETPLFGAFDGGVGIASAAEDPLIFADDEYKDVGSLKVRIPDTISSSSSSLASLFHSNSDIILADQPERTPMYCKPESSQTSHSPPSPTTTPLREEPNTLNGKGKKHSPMFGLQVPTSRIAERPLERWEDLTPRGDFDRELELKTRGQVQSEDVLATPRKPRHHSDSREYGHPTIPAFDLHIQQERLTPQDSEGCEDGAHNSAMCDTCQAVDQLQTRTRMSPCGHLACFTCLTASINIVGANGTKAKCTCCHQVVLDFAPGHKAAHTSSRMANEAMEGLEQLCDRPENARSVLSVPTISEYVDSSEPVVLRIDNIAWDATPDMLEQFLPPDVLADTMHPVHVLLSRWDGRSKDYLFVEVKNSTAARRVLQQKQNAILGTGARARPVTITLSTEEELVEELRPESRAELMKLLELCHTALARNIGHDDFSRNGALPGSLSNSSLGIESSDSYRSIRSGGSPLKSGIFLKSRYASFWGVLSLVSKLSSGQEVYWDMFHVVAGVISILAKHLVKSSFLAESVAARGARNNLDHLRDAATDARGPSALQFLAAAGSEGSLSTLSSDGDLKVSELNAKIRKKLEEEVTRASKAQASMQATLLRKQQQNWDLLDIGGPKRKDRSQSDAKMLQKFLGVFENRFNVQVKLQRLG